MSGFVWIFLLNLLLHPLEAYRVLVIVPLPSKSHSILGESLVKLIADAGNEVTYLTSFHLKNPLPRVTEVIVLEEKEKEIWRDNLDLQKVLEGKLRLNNVKGFVTMVNKLNLRILQNSHVQMLLNDPSNKFDVIIAEWMYNDIYAGLTPIFDCPFIWLSTVELHWQILRLIDSLPNSAFVPDIISDSQPPFTFVQRLKQLGYQVSGLLLDYFYTSKLQKAQYDKIIAPIIRKRGKPVPDFKELRFNVSLVLGNSHVSLGNALSLPLNYKHVAGYHISKNTKPLKGNLKKLLDSAKHGVIYFSLGSNLKSDSFPNNLKNSLMNMFGSLNHTVLWKFEDDIPNKPNNVHILKWAPQESILAHPNCILFITHGGYLSMIEAVHFGKPVIGIPVYGDQFNNVVSSVQKGYARKVDLSYTMADEIQIAIQEILSNPSYGTKAKELSFIYFHRPVSPAVELVHWVDHVVLTRGALHLRSPALLVPWYQSMYLDIILMVLGTIFGLKILITRLYCMLCRKVRNKKKVN